MAHVLIRGLIPGDENEGRSEFVLPLALLVAGGACPLSGIGPRLPSLLLSPMFVDGFFQRSASEVTVAELPGFEVSTK